MSMQVGEGGGEERLVSEINVTPLVDVMLVLLIIFMVAAPMMVQGINVNLPQATAKALDTKNERLVITLSAEKKVFFDNVEVGQDNLIPKVKAVIAQRSDQQVYLRADSDVPYGFVVAIMAALKEAGVDRLGMVTEPADSRPAPEQKKDAKDQAKGTAKK